MKYLRANIILYGVILLSNSSKSQTGVLRSNILDHFAFSGNHLEINYIIFQNRRAVIKNNLGSKYISSKNSIGTGVGIGYRINLKKNQSLLLGADAVSIGRNLVTTIFRNEFSPELINDYHISTHNSKSNTLVLSMKMAIEKHWNFKGRTFIISDAGLKINFSLGADYETTDFSARDITGTFKKVGNLNVIANNDQSPWLTIPISVGQGWLLRNNNLFQLKAHVNFSFTPFVRGEYEFPSVNGPTTGFYKNYGTYFGFIFSYSFTNANYRIRKKYQMPL